MQHTQTILCLSHNQSLTMFEYVHFQLRFERLRVENKSLNFSLWNPSYCISSEDLQTQVFLLVTIHFNWIENSSVNIVLNIFCVPQKKYSTVGVKEHVNDDIILIFGWTLFFIPC